MDQAYLFLLVALAVLVGFALFRVIDRAGSRSSISDPRDQAIRPDTFIPWGRWTPGQASSIALTRWRASAADGASRVA